MKIGIVKIDKNNAVGFVAVAENAKKTQKKCKFFWKRYRLFFFI